MTAAESAPERRSAPLRYIPLSYHPGDSQASALRLVLALNPHWESGDGKIEFIRFTDGITNTVRIYCSFTSCVWSPMAG
jgi:ethanolamine kinase